MATRPLEPLPENVTPFPVPDPAPISEAQAEAEESAAPAEASAVRAAAPAPGPDLPYTLGEWGGKTQYRCTRCPWDCLDDPPYSDENTFWLHWGGHLMADAALATPLAPASGLLIADRFGNVKE